MLIWCFMMTVRMSALVRLARVVAWRRLLALVMNLQEAFLRLKEIGSQLSVLRIRKKMVEQMIPALLRLQRV